MEKVECPSQVKLIIKFKKFLSCIFLIPSVVSFLFLASTNIFATEGGGGAYPNGAEDFMAGAVPPPGTYFINYVTYYFADEFRDGNGNTLMPGFDLDVTANTLRFIHITEKKFFGGFWGVHIFVPIVNIDVKTAFGNDSKTGLGDIIIDPFFLSWHSKNWHFATGIDIYLPTGDYEKEDLANVGRNYWTFEPVFAFTYVSDSGFDVSAKFMYDINTKNDDCIYGEYLSGQEFHFDYTIGKKFGNWSAGLGGYYYKQITDDELNNEKIGPDGFKGQALAIGPQLKYDHKNMSFILKYQIETKVENKPEGDKFWFTFVYAF